MPKARSAVASVMSAAGPILGVHKSQAQIDTVGTSPASVVFDSTVAGSAFALLCAGHLANIATPTDSKSNTYTQRGSDQAYAGGLWPGFGIRIYAVTSGAGGGSHTIQTVKSTSTEEISIAGIEICKGASVQDATQGNSAPTGLGVGYASPTVTTTGRALILALWSGDGDAGTTDQSVVPSAPWALIESAFLAQTAYVQFAVAYLNAPGAGTYGLIWKPAVNQGAAMSMIAIQ